MEERLVLVIFIQFLYTVFSFCTQNLKYHVLKTPCFAVLRSQYRTYIHLSLQQNVPRNVTMGGRVNRMEVVIVRKVTKENSAKKVVPSILRVFFFFRIINEKSNQKEKLFFNLRYEKFSFSAICSPRCKNGGKCVRPGVCSCPRGFRKPTCKGEKLYHVQDWSMSWFLIPFRIYINVLHSFQVVAILSAKMEGNAGGKTNVNAKRVTQEKTALLVSIWLQNYFC